jgi:hypothetical protein
MIQDTPWFGVRFSHSQFMAKSTVPISDRLPNDPTLREELLNCILTRTSTPNFRIQKDGYVRGRGRDRSIGPAVEVLSAIREQGGFSSVQPQPSTAATAEVENPKTGDCFCETGGAEPKEETIDRFASLVLYATAVLLIAFVVFLFWAVPTAIQLFANSEHWR